MTARAGTTPAGTTPTGTTLLLGSPLPEVRDLAAALGAELVPLPPASDADDWSWAPELERWRATVAGGDPVERVVVAAWSPTLSAGPLVETGTGPWVDRAEQPLARWVAALGAAVRRVTDGGTVVAVVDRPPPLDCAGWAPESAVADAAHALVRSLAQSEGARGVRVNLVSTPARLGLADVVAPRPPLPTFPGRLDPEVVGAVRMLLGPDACGVTGTAVHADCGRSWR